VEVLVTVVNDFRIENKFLGVTADNTSLNDTMAAALKQQLPSFLADKDCTFCFAHIINLVAKSLLKMSDPPKKTDSTSDKDGDNDEDEPNDFLDLDELLPELNDLERTSPECDDDDDIFDEVAHMLNDERNLFF
jgi:hypothetical protein